MAPIKRKNESSTHPQDGSSKKQKGNASVPRKVSSLREEEPAFVRGGASVLTPLEHKKIQIKAQQDVLFEQQTGKKPVLQFDSEGEENDMEGIEEPETTSSAPKAAKKKQKLKKGKEKHSTRAEAVLKIEGLSYRRLAIGSMALGQVTQINKYDVALSLPNNLTGYVPLTAISAGLMKEAHDLAARDLPDDESEASSDTDEIDLKSFFYIGQYLRASVTSLSNTDHRDKKGKKHIELSVAPEQANVGLKAADLPTSSIVQGEVKSVEDHGVVIDLALEDSKVKGFISSKEIDPAMNMNEIKQGAVMLCMVTGKSSNGNIIKLSADPGRIGNFKKGNVLTEASTIDSFLPGVAVEVLVSEVHPSGLAGKVIGVLDATVDIIHSGPSKTKPLDKLHPVGSKVKARVICTFPTSEGAKIGVSLLDHVLSMVQKQTTGELPTSPIQSVPVSTIISEAKVTKIDQNKGLFLSIGVKGVQGFAHISRVSDDKIDTLSETTGPYKLGSTHKCRIVGYNQMDGLFLVSLEQKILDLPFLQLEDVRAGEVVKGTIEELVTKDGIVKGALVKLTDSISGFVPEVHLADVRLQHPARKFKSGTAVTARVLSSNLEDRRLTLTLKKTLVNSDAPAWVSYSELRVGMHSPGTLRNVLPNGASVQFYGNVHGFLPVSQMSESYLKDATQHFRTGQVVNVHILSIDPEQKRLLVSCRNPTGHGPEQDQALKELVAGTAVQGTVTENTIVSEKTQGLDKARGDIIVDLAGSGLKAVISQEHLVDGSIDKAEKAAKKIRVGTQLQDVKVLSINKDKRIVRLTSKPSLIKAFSNGTVPKSFEDIQVGAKVTGFVRNITLTGVFVQFANELTGLMLKAHLPEEAAKVPEFGMKRFQPIEATVLSLDSAQRRFLLTQKSTETKPISAKKVDTDQTKPFNYSVGQIAEAKIISVKETQLNVQLDDVQGRIDVSEVFDSWDDIKDRKHPLVSFNNKQTLPVRILGVHDSRNHRFLPITNVGKAPVLELTAKKSSLESEELSILTMDRVKEGVSYLCFVNNVQEDCVWVNLTPNVRGRIRVMDLSDDVSLLSNIAKNFPVGSAIRAIATRVDTSNNRLDLCARADPKPDPFAIDNLAEGSILPGKVTKVTERNIMIQISDNLSAPVNLANMADNFEEANPTKYSKNQIVRVCILKIDAPNKKLLLSTRPSRILSSSLSVKDPEILNLSAIKVNDIVRGFIKSVADNGLFVNLGGDVDAFVRIAELSDAFLRDWKSNFEVDTLVKGKVISVDNRSNNVQLSLKESALDPNYKPPLTYTDLYVGQVLTGKVRKVEDFGVFIVIDNSRNVSGLCHRSEMASGKYPDVKKLYDEGDVVKAKVLAVDLEKRRISLGLKAAYFKDEHADIENDEENDDTDEEGGAVLELSSDEGSEGELDDRDVDMDDVPSIGSEGGDTMELDQLTAAQQETLPSQPTLLPQTTGGLSAGGFDWTGSIFDNKNVDEEPSSDEEDEDLPKKKKHKKAEIKVDRTGDLDANGPQSVADFERLLMGQPNSSYLWLSYMAFQLQLSEIGKARDIAERAIRTINKQSRDTQEESLNVWIAYLNLENAYGNEERVEDVFKRACEFNDAEEVHSRLASIYIQSAKNQKADELLGIMVKKFSQNPKNWLNYATFLFDTLGDPSRARELLPRALQALPKHHHLEITKSFARLEFSSGHGESELGRTMFEGLISTFPKRLDLWNVLLDLEMKSGDQEQVRRLFDRVASSNLKPKKAKFFFKRWLEYEEKYGDTKSRDKVQAKAAEYVRQQASEGGKQDEA